MWIEGLFTLKDGFSDADNACDMRHIVGAIVKGHDGQDVRVEGGEEVEHFEDALPRWEDRQ